MMRKLSTRIPVNFEAELILAGKIYAGVIENVSESGIFVKISPMKDAIDFTPGTPLEVKFQLPSGETLNLHCKIIWSDKNPPDGLTNNIGLQIIETSSTYEEFLKPLFSNHTRIL